MSKFLRAYWPRIVGTAFGAGLLGMLFTAHYGDVEVGSEFWWEVPFFLFLTVSVWIPFGRRAVVKK